MEPVGLDFINQRVGPWFRDGCARRPRWPTGPADQLPKPSGTPGSRQLQPAPLERLPAAFLGVVIVPGG